MAEITKCLVNGKSPSLIYKEPYSNFKIHETATVHQHHQLLKKVDPALNDPPDHELIINLPPKVKIEPVVSTFLPYWGVVDWRCIYEFGIKDPFSTAVQNALAARNNLTSKRDSPDVGATTPALTRSDTLASLSFKPLIVRIEYVIEHVRDGFTFVGCDAGDMRYPHAYTNHSPLPGAACCLFPTLDGIHERWTWEIEVTVPKTIGDIEKSASPQVNGNGAAINGVNSVNGAHESPDDIGDIQADEDSDLDMTVICSGNYKDEVC